MEPSTQKINVSEKVDEMDEFLEQGNVREAATLAIATLSSVDDGKVFIYIYFFLPVPWDVPTFWAEFSNAIQL